MEAMIIGVFTESENNKLQFDPIKLIPFKGVIKWDDGKGFFDGSKITITGEIEDKYGYSFIEGELFSKDGSEKGTLKFLKKYKDRTFIYNLKRDWSGWSGYWLKIKEDKKDLEVDGFVYLSISLVSSL